jgi:hypothetical protein
MSAAHAVEEDPSSSSSEEDAGARYRPGNIAGMLKVSHPPHHPLVRQLTTHTLQELQIENIDLRKQLRLSSSGAVSSASSVASVTPNSVTPNPLEQYKKDFDQLGRHFCTFNEIWVRSRHLRKPYPENLRKTGPRHPSRYSNDQSKQDGVVAELYEFIPNRFHTYLEGSPCFEQTVSTFSTSPDDATLTYTQFISGADSMRAYIISNVRKNAHIIFPVTIKSEVYATEYDRSREPVITQLLRNPKYPDKDYPQYCSVLYKDGVTSGPNLFGGVAILRVCFSPSFLAQSNITQ